MYSCDNRPVFATTPCEHSIAVLNSIMLSQSLTGGEPYFVLKSEIELLLEQELGIDDITVPDNKFYTDTSTPIDLNINHESWVEIPNFESLYEVSNLGVVRRPLDYKSPGTGPGKFIKPTVNRSGFNTIVLFKGGKRYRRNLDLLVITSFVGPAEEPNLSVSHLDGNPTNDSLDNLAWGNYRKDLFKNNSGPWKPRPYVSRELAEELKTKYDAGVSQISLGKRFDLSPYQVWRIIHDKIKDGGK